MFQWVPTDVIQVIEKIPFISNDVVMVGFLPLKYGKWNFFHVHGPFPQARIHILADGLMGRFAISAGLGNPACGKVEQFIDVSGRIPF